jgi:putative N6-adenine-specific DNA methylase
LIIIKEDEIRNEDQLYASIKKIPWEDYFSIRDTFAVDAVTNSETFRHSKYAALKSKDAIVDRFYSLFNRRPNVNPLHPDFGINIHIRQNTLTVSLDSSGDSLHMRGYRAYLVDAPINEVLAAGLVLLSTWDKKSPLHDPMCGSGTILIEAANIALNKPPHNPTKNFMFKKWKNFDGTLWKKIVDEAKNVERKDCPKITGADKILSVVKGAETNIAEAGLSHCIDVKREDFFRSQSVGSITIITNPPYDERLALSDAYEFYKQIGNKLKKDYVNSTAFIISGNLDALKKIGLKTSRKHKLYNGAIESHYHQFEIYEGSKINTVHDFGD